VAGGRIGSFASLGLCVGLCGLQMCQLCVGRISIFFVRWGKNKKHRVGLSVGLLVVPFEYVRYVGHLSKWFVFVLRFKIWSVSLLVNGRPTIGYNSQIYSTLNTQTRANRSKIAGFAQLINAPFFCMKADLRAGIGQR
jgi:hypothetical protein